MIDRTVLPQKTGFQLALVSLISTFSIVQLKSALVGAFFHCYINSFFIYSPLRLHCYVFSVDAGTFSVAR